MTETENVPENPPAFPAFIPGSLAEHPGMSLRDWFAGQALPEVLVILERRTVGLDAEKSAAAFAAGANIAYQIADAMLAARKDSQ